MSESRHFSAPAHGAYGPPRDHAQAEATRHIHQSLFQLGEQPGFDAVHEIPKVCAWLESQAIDWPDAVLSAIRVMATEQPHKTALVAALIAHTALAPSDAKAAEAPEAGTTVPPALGARLIDYLAQSLADDAEAHYWRQLRLTLHVLAALVPLGLVDADTLLQSLQAVANVLQADTASRSVTDAAAFCVLDVVGRAGADLLSPPSDADKLPMSRLDVLVSLLRAYTDRRGAPSALLAPFAPAAPTSAYEFLQDETWLDRMRALEDMQTDRYTRPAFLPRAADLLPDSVLARAREQPLGLRTHRLPALEVPVMRSTAHDQPDVGALAPPPHLNTGKGLRETVSARIGAPPMECAARWFGASVPPIGAMSGVVLRTVVQDVIDLYVVNRKEAAHILYSLPQWCRRGTFDAPVPESVGLFGAPQEDTGGPWSLEDVLLEGALSVMLVLPAPPQLELYYSSLLRELVTLAPQQVAPSIGRTIRRFYGACAEGRVHAEVLRRLADWFSVHLSNFNFTWAWSEWEDDAARPWPHPRRALARRLVELEVRLAYYDRIKSTLPPELELSLLAPWEPAPVYVYGDASHAYHNEAMQLLHSLKAKASGQVVQADLQSFRQRISPPQDDVPALDDHHVESAAEAERVVRDLAVQTLLQAGSRSFSHLLNVIERYHELLRALSQTPEARVSMLESTTQFWTHSAQWVLIVCDKLLQYRIVEPVDVVHFVFADTPLAADADAPFALATHSSAWGSSHRDWSSFHWPALLRLTVDKVVGRVGQLRRRVDELRQLEAGGASEAEAPSTRNAPASVDEAQVHLDAMLLEQRQVLVAIMAQLVQVLGKDVGVYNDESDSDAWQIWWRSEWYRAFLATHYHVLAANKELILANVFAKAAADDVWLVLFQEACALDAA